MTEETKNPFPNRAFDEFGQISREHIMAGVEISEPLDAIFATLGKHGFNARESYNILQVELYIRSKISAEKQKPPKEKK